MRTIGTITIGGGKILCRKPRGAEWALPLAFTPADLTDESKCAEVLEYARRCWHPGVRVLGRQQGDLSIFDVVEHPASIEAAVRELVEVAQ